MKAQLRLYSEKLQHTFFYRCISHNDNSALWGNWITSFP